MVATSVWIAVEIDFKGKIPFNLSDRLRFVRDRGVKIKVIKLCRVQIGKGKTVFGDFVEYDLVVWIGDQVFGNEGVIEKRVFYFFSLLGKEFEGRLAVQGCEKVVVAAVHFRVELGEIKDI